MVALGGSLSKVAPLSELVARAGSRATRALEHADLLALVDDVDGLLPGNGLDDSFEYVANLLATGEIVDLLGKPGARHALNTAVVQGDDGARVLAIARDGERTDVAAEQFFTDIARAAGMQDFVAPMATSADGRLALVQFVPHQILDAADVGDVATLRDVMARGYVVADGLAIDEARHVARVDTEIVAALDRITRHADRHGSNALVDATTGRLTLIDHEMLGGGSFYYTDEFGDTPLLHPLVQGGTTGSVSHEFAGEQLVEQVVTMHPDSVDHLAGIEPSALSAAHDRLAASPLHPKLGDLGEWIRTQQYRDQVLGDLAKIVDDGGWSYIPIVSS